MACLDHAAELAEGQVAPIQVAGGTPEQGLPDADLWNMRWWWAAQRPREILGYGAGF